MARLNQIIAVVNGKKSQTQKTLTEIHHSLQKTEPLFGISRSYQPKDEEGEKLPAESKHVQVKVKESIDKAAAALTDLFDVVATQDQANSSARADIVVEGRALLSQVPVTTLLFLEKQLTDIHTFVEKLPTLDPAETWHYDPTQDCFATDPVQTTRTKKVPRAFVKYEATKEHPAQVETFTEDTIVGHWTAVKFSGAIPAKRRNDLLERVRKLQDAVKMAREEANSAEVQNVKIGERLFSHLFGS